MGECQSQGRESKPGERSDEPVRTGATRRETDMSTATARDETRRAIAKLPTPRASLVADLADHVRELAFVGDLEAARIAGDALARLLNARRVVDPTSTRFLWSKLRSTSEA